MKTLLKHMSDFSVSIETQMLKVITGTGLTEIFRLIQSRTQ